MEVRLVPPVIDAPRKVAVEAVDMQTPHSAVVAFSDIKDATCADMVTGCHCLVAEDDVDPEVLSDARRGSGPALEGWTFRDVASGKSGRVINAQDMPSQMLLTVSVDGEGGSEHMVPLVDELVVDLDEGARHMTLKLPDGIFEL